MRTVALLLSLVALVGACRTRPALPPLDPNRPIELHAEGLPAGELQALAQLFYERCSNRRFNSIATFHDPALREFFQEPAAFNDYYAGLVQLLTHHRFEANRANQVELLEVDIQSPDRVLVTVRFTGGNDRPLRWWNTSFETQDQWQRSEGRWWIIPGKL